MLGAVMLLTQLASGAPPPVIVFAELEVDAPDEAGGAVEARPDAGAARALAIEGGACVRGARKVRARASPSGAVTDLGFTVPCALAAASTDARSREPPPIAALQAGGHEDRVALTVLPFRASATQRALVVEHVAGFEWVITSRALVAWADGTPKVVWRDASSYHQGGRRFSALIEQQGDHDSLVHFHDAYGSFTADRVLLDVARGAAVREPLPVWAVIYQTWDAGEPSPALPPCASARAGTHETARFPRLARHKLIAAELFESEAAAAAALPAARACAPDAYVKRAR